MANLQSMAIGFVIFLTCLSWKTAGRDEVETPKEQPSLQQLSRIVQQQNEKLKHHDDMLQQQQSMIEAQQEQLYAFQQQNEKLKHLEDSLQTLRQQKSETSQQINTLSEQVDNRVHVVNAMSHVGNTGTDGQANLQDAMTNATATGVTYVRWGRNHCNGSAIPLYRGYVGGGRYPNLLKPATDMMCLPDNPEWGNTAASAGSYVYGAEYRFTSDPFSTENAGVSSLKYQNAPCVVCHALSKSDVLMIPARRSCPIGWTVEYLGYLVSRYASGKYECFDDAPEVVAAIGQHDDSYDLYAAVPNCPSMPCPPYTEDYNIACVVCTR